MKEQDKSEIEFNKLPPCVAEYIRQVLKKMRYRKEVRRDVQAELTAHFEDELKDSKTDEDKEQKAQQLITEFGDVKLLGVLLRRAKKRCRPLWRTVVARTFQTVGVLILCLLIYLGWFLTGKPNISIDYVARFNQMTRPQVLDEDNAWPHYQRAIELYVEPTAEVEQLRDFWSLLAMADKKLGDLTETERTTVGKWAQKNEAAWQEFVAASAKPYCYRKYEVGEGNSEKWTIGILLPHLTTLKKLSKLGIWRSRTEDGRGRPRQAFQTCLGLARVGSHWQRKATIIEQLVGLAISSMAHEEILRIVSTKKLSGADLIRCQEQLSDIYPQGYPLMNMESERLFFLDTVQQVFTDGGPGGGHLIPKKLIYLLDSIRGYRAHVEVAPFYALGGSIIHARRNETIAKANWVYDRLIEISRMTPYKRHLRKVESDNIIEALPRYRYALIRYFVPALDNASRIGYSCKALHEATVTVLALHTWRLEKGSYPAGLHELVEQGYLEELPMDPYSDNPLVYQRTTDDFILYSVGRNFEDDGGQVIRDDKGRLRKWAGGEGDTVFWPICE